MDRWNNESSENLEKKIPSQGKNLGEASNIYIIENDVKSLKIEFPDKKNFLTEKLSYIKKVSIALMNTKNQLTN